MRDRGTAVSKAMGYGYGAGSGPFALLWCFVWIDLLSRIYGPWVPFVALSVLAMIMLIGVLAMLATSTAAENAGSAFSISNMTHSHADTYSYDAWWVNVIFLVVFAVIFVIPVVNYEPDYTERDRPPYKEDAKRSDRVATAESAGSSGREPQRPLLPIPVSEV